MDLSFLPSVNASLNALAACFLVAGFVTIKTGRIGVHKACMLIATGVSGLFLISYVTHHVWRSTIQGGTHRAFAGVGLLRTAYYIMLLTHVILAVTVPFFALRLVWLGFTGSLRKHKRLAKVAFPIWMYVSITGVLIYLALYWYTPGS